MTPKLLFAPHAERREAAANRLNCRRQSTRMDVLDPHSDPELWDRQVLSHPDATIFHSAAWAQVLSRTYGQKPHYLRLHRSCGEPAAVIPIMEVRSPITGRRAVCLPFSDFCAPLLFEGCDAGAIQDRLTTIATERHWKYIELRGQHLQLPSSTGAADREEAAPTFYGHRLDLTIGIDALLAGCSSSVRRALRKAARSELSVSIDHSATAMREFFRLHARTRRRHGLPPQPYRFFKIIHEELISEGSGFIVLVSDRERTHPIAAAVFLRFGDSAIYKFGASDESGWSLRPNNLAMWEGIRHLAQSGVKHLHLGRTSPGQEGLRRFKLSLGSREEPIHYIRYQTRTGSWRRVIPDSASTVSRFANKIFGHAPLAINRLVGTLLYPHLD